MLEIPRWSKNTLLYHERYFENYGLLIAGSRPLSHQTIFDRLQNLAYFKVGLHKNHVGELSVLFFEMIMQLVVTSSAK